MTPEELRAARRELELTQEGMASALGCHRRHYQQMEKGERPITPDRARAIEALRQGDPVPPDLRGGSDRGRRVDQSRADYELEPAGLTLGRQTIAVAVFAAAMGAVLWGMSRLSSGAAKSIVS